MVILYFLLALIAVILARTLVFTPKKQEEKTFDAVEFDREASIRSLTELVRCRTVSYDNPPRAALSLEGKNSWRTGCPDGAL